MGASVSDDVLDAALNEIATSTRCCVCSTEPTTYTEAITTYKLADVDSITFTGPANGDASGRKIAFDAENAVPIDSSGTALHVALVDVGNTALQCVTTCTSQVLTGGGTVNIPAFDMEIADPTTS